MSNYKLIGPFSEILTMSGMPLKGALADKALKPLKNCSILIKDDLVVSVDTHEVLLERAHKVGAKIIKIDGDNVCLPGLIDAHTHICFAGSRAKDYAMRNAGKTYLDIAKEGGGIWDTVTKTRAASLDELVEGIVTRAERHLNDGITTIEVKSGYGLSVEEELKMLRAIKSANTKVVQDLIPTCLAAHILPRDFDGDHKAYLDLIAKELFPILKRENLCNRIDAFIEEEAFSGEVVQEYFTQAREVGFDITVHADQFSSGGSRVAVDHGAISADHLEASNEEDIKRLASSDVISIALPGASMGLGVGYTPARKILDAGGVLAIASDWNPGSAPMGDLVMQAAVLGAYEKLSNAEVLAGITYRAAAALNLSDRGTIEEHQIADLCIYKTSEYRDILYHQGRLKPSIVIKNGVIIKDV